MDRVSIKQEAKSKIKGNLWTIWKPLVLFELFVFIFAFVIALIVALIKPGETVNSIVMSIMSILISLAEAGFALAYTKYVLSFIRGDKFEWHDVIEYTKKHWVRGFLLGLVVGLIVIIGSLLLVIPGIIAAIGLMFYEEVAVDNEDLGTIDVVKKSWEITKGKKMDLFVFALSFIGWTLLAGLTFGILYIWLLPYMVVAMTMVYEKIK